MNLNKHEANDLFSSSDLALVGTIALWYPIESIDRNNSKIIFYFKRDKKFDKIIQQYWRKELKIEPQTYFSQLKAVKARLYGND